MLEIVTKYTWPNDPIPFAGLRIRVDDLAIRYGVAIQNWDVDGLGPASGFGFRLPSGRVYFLEELEHAVQFQGASGPCVYVDAAQLAEFDVEVLASEVSGALGLSRAKIMTDASDDVRQFAAELVSKIAASRAKRGY